MNDDEVIYSANVERSLRVVAAAWENKSITADEMVAQLEELVAVCEGDSDYNRLINKFDMTNILDS